MINTFFLYLKYIGYLIYLLGAYDYLVNRMLIKMSGPI